MFKSNHRQTFTGVAIVLLTLGISSLALKYFVPAPPSTITIATGVKGTSFDYYGQLYRVSLAGVGLKVELRETAGGLENVKLLQDAKSGVDAAFVTGGISDGSHARGLLSLGSVFSVPFWLFYSSAEPIHRLSQFKGKRIAAGPEGSGARLSFEKILGKAGVNSETATVLPLGGLDAVSALKDGRVDAVWFNGGAGASAVQSLLKDPRVRLMDFPLAEAFTRIFPDVVQLSMPKGLIEIDPPNPSHDVTLLGTTSKVLIRSTLHPALIQLLLQTIKEEHGSPGLFQQAGEFPTSTDSEYPMAQIAVEYYKNGLSMISKYLPFWVAVYAKRTIALLFASLAIVLPVFNFAPKLHGWLVQESLRKLYRRLRIVENAVQTELTLSQVEALQSELGDINRAASAVPMRRSDLFFIFRYHLDKTRSRLTSRCAEAQKQGQRLKSVKS